MCIIIERLVGTEAVQRTCYAQFSSSIKNYYSNKDSYR